MARTDDGIAEGLQAIAHALHRLGNADASTQMGGMEALGLVLSISIDRLADAMRDVARAIDDLKL